MFENAVIATDMSESSERFTLCKEGLHKLGVRKILIGLCIRLYDVRNLRDSVEELFQSEIEQRRIALEKLGYEVDIETLAGEPPTEINRIAGERNCGLVIVGSRVHSLAGEVFLGSLSGELLHHCRFPLLVLRQPAEPMCREKCPLASLERVLFPTDFSTNAERAFGSLLELAGRGLRSVVLMHVQDRSRIERHLVDRLEEFNAIDQGRLERMKDALTAAGVQDVQIELPYGYPTQEILQRSKQGDISLVVMGSQGRGFISEVFLGSVSHNTVRHTHVPVLLIPALR